MWPSFSYVPSPASYSSAAAIASPGRTKLFSMGVVPHAPSDLYFARARPGGGPHDAEEDDGDLPHRLRVEGHRVRERERVRLPVGRLAPELRDLPQHERLRLRLVERVRHGRGRERPLEERHVRVAVPGLRPERRVPQDP